MIRIVRAPEPPRLGGLRTTGLNSLLKFGVGSHPTGDDIGNSYRIVSNDLWKMQDYKCCYCEFMVVEDYNDVEHYRPKAQAIRQPGSDEIYGYWWLTWTWGNLFFACPSCNRSGKNDAFPLAVGSVALLPHEQPPKNETPLLLNPETDDPLAHLIFRPTRIENGKFLRWSVLPRNGSARGIQTINELKLNRPNLLDHYDRHVELYIRDEVSHLRAVIGSAGNIAVEWQRVVDRRLKRRMPFAALSFDALDFFFPLYERTMLGVTLPEPS